MLKKTITYEDYEGKTRTEDFFFNLTRSEIIKMENSEVGGLTKLLGKIVQAEDQPSIMKYFDIFVAAAYGEKSADGRQFIKSEEMSKAFFQTPAYDVLFMELIGDANAAADFINAIVPQYKSDDVNGEQSDK